MTLGEVPFVFVPPFTPAAGIARWIVAQLAVLHSPLDLEFVFLLDPGAAGRWDWARWLPHTRDAAIDPDDLGTTIARLSAVVATRRSSRPAGPSAWSGPWTVVVLDRASSLAAVAGLPELLGDGPGVGVTVVCIDPAARGLPAACTSLVRSEHAGGSRIGVRTQAGTVRVDTVDVVGDRVPAAWAEDVARALAPLVDAGNSGAAALPTRCSLGDLMALDIDAVTARWGASDGGAHTVVGVAPDGPLTVDLGRDGPHALIAGTTGSGKSELLRTLVIGLAATHPPSELTFLLIDYKGGAAFDECAALPHTAGLVTDLDQHLTRRALTSLHAELRRREQLFADVSAADLTVYRALGPKAPVARLVIVVDEFAALAVELPDFVSGLVGVAQRGRSLGVHLVLATQRPGTALSPEIRANTSLRIALRMTDAAESTDVIDGPGAALLDSAVPGRAFLRAGSSPVPFQTAAACGEAAGEPVVEILDHWRRRPVHPRPSGCDEAGRLVAALSDCAMRSGQPAARSPWRDVLPEAVCQLDLPSDDATIALGRVDRPEHQEQPLLDLDLRACESTLVVGRSGSGRSTALATIALGAAAVSDPLQLEIYVVDGRGDLLSTLIGLPHVATAIGPDHIDSTARLLQRLHSDARTRRRPGGVLPLRLLLLDAWDAVLSGLDEVEAARCIDLLTTLIRSGAMTVAVSGDRSLLLPRFAGGFGTRLLLALSDRNDYALGGVRLRDVPTELPPGRGVRAGDGVTFQLAHPGRTLRPGSARSRAQEVVARWAAAGGRSNASPTAVRLRPLPSQVSLSVAAAGSAPLVLGLAGDAAAPCSVDLVAHRARFLIAGPPRAGKSVTLCVLLAESLRLGVDVVVAATNRSPLTVAARAAGVRVILPGDSQAAAGPAPTRPTMLLVDDSDAFVDGAGADRLVTWLQNPDAPLATAVAGRYDDLAATYRGVAAQVRRDRCGLLLRPGPIDGELLGIRVGRRADDGPPGRGLIVGDPRWGPLFDSGEPVPIQVAQP
ncbi:MAG: FtsK/SpoIIIE domain-containing protein [Jatrophihabitans sp.]